MSKEVKKAGLLYRRRILGVKHEMKLCVIVGKSGQLRLMAEG